MRPGHFCLAFQMVSAVLTPQRFAGSFFCQDDAVALRWIAADRDGKLAQVGMAQKLAGGVKAVAVAVQNDAVHRVHLVS